LSTCLHPECTLLQTCIREPHAPELTVKELHRKVDDLTALVRQLLRSQGASFMPAPPEGLT
jgi:hypothetical protein